MGEGIWESQAPPRQPNLRGKSMEKHVFFLEEVSGYGPAQ